VLVLDCGAGFRMLSMTGVVFGCLVFSVGLWRCFCLGYLMGFCTWCLNCVSVGFRSAVFLDCMALGFEVWLYLVVLRYVVVCLFCYLVCCLPGCCNLCIIVKGGGV